MPLPLEVCAPVCGAASCEMPPTMLHFNCEQSSMGTPQQGRRLHHNSLHLHLCLCRSPSTFKTKASHIKEKLSESRSATEACFNLLMGIYRTATATVTVPIFLASYPAPYHRARCTRENTHKSSRGIWPTVRLRLRLQMRLICALRRGALRRVASRLTASRNLDY